MMGLIGASKTAVAVAILISLCEDLDKLPILPSKCGRWGADVCEVELGAVCGIGLFDPRVPLPSLRLRLQHAPLLGGQTKDIDKPTNWQTYMRSVSRRHKPRRQAAAQEFALAVKDEERLTGARERVGIELAELRWGIARRLGRWEGRRVFGRNDAGQD